MKSEITRTLTDSSIIYHGSPVLIQSKFGNRGNFELVSCFRAKGPLSAIEPPFGGGGLVHFFRNNNNSDLPWSIFIPLILFPFPWTRTSIDNLRLPLFETITFIQSNFGSDNFSMPANFEVIGRIGDRLKYIWRESRYPFYWRNTDTFLQIDNNYDLTGVTGNPSLIQGRFGNRQMNFELCVPLVGGGICHLYKVHDGVDPGKAPWRLGNNGESIDSKRRYQAVSLIQSDYGRPQSPGNLELVARTDDKLALFWLDSGNPTWWNGPSPIMVNEQQIVGVTGLHSLIQSTFGKRQRNFQLVAPLISGGFMHFVRDNDNDQLKWYLANDGRPIDPTRRYQALSLIQSNFRSTMSSPGNLEVTALTSEGVLLHFWMNSETKIWNGPYDFSSF